MVNLDDGTLHPIANRVQKKQDRNEIDSTHNPQTGRVTGSPALRGLHNSLATALEPGGGKLQADEFDEPTRIFVAR